MDRQRLERIADLANLDVNIVQEWVEYDWPEYSYSDIKNHVNWLKTASDKEIADWIKAGYYND